MGQQDISRNAGALWNSLKARDSPIAVACKSIEERWKKQHQQAYPNYQYEPRPSRRSTKSNSRSPSVNARRKSGGKIRRETRRYESESEFAESVSDSEEDEWRPKARSARTAVARSVTSTHSYAIESALNVRSRLISLTIPTTTVSNGLLLLQSPTSPFILYDLVDDAQAHGSPSLISSDSSPSTSSSIQLPETPVFVPDSLPGQSSLEDSYLVSDFIAFTARTRPTHRRSAHAEEATMPVLDDRSLSHDQQLAHIFNGLEAVAMDADWLQAGFAIPNLDDISNSLNLLEPLSYFLKPLQMPQKTPYVGFGHSNLPFTHPTTSPTLHLHHFAPNSAFHEATADSIPSTASNMCQTSAIDVDLLNNTFDS